MNQQIDEACFLLLTQMWRLFSRLSLLGLLFFWVYPRRWQSVLEEQRNQNTLLILMGNSGRYCAPFNQLEMDKKRAVYKTGLWPEGHPEGHHTLVTCSSAQLQCFTADFEVQVTL